MAFLDGDDVWLPTKTEKQVAFLKAGLRDFVAVDHMLMTEEGQLFAYALARHLPMPSTWMIRRNTMIRYPFNPHLGEGEDGDWWLTTWNTVRKHRLPESLIKYRVRGRSLSTTTPQQTPKACLRTIRLPARDPLAASGCDVCFAQGEPASLLCPGEELGIAGSSSHRLAGGEGGRPTASRSPVIGRVLPGMHLAESVDSGRGAAYTVAVTGY